LSAGQRLEECLDALASQTRRDFEVVVVDNSGQGLVRASGAGQHGATVLEPDHNVGFGAAINLGFHRSRTPYLAALNDDAAPRPQWMEALVAAAEAHPEAGMFASQVRFYGEEHLDSAGMVISGDASSKQRGHLFPAGEFDREEEVLLPSASAALYRRTMLDEVGLFDEDFFRTAKIPILACGRDGPAGNASMCRLRWWIIITRTRRGAPRVSRRFMWNATGCLWRSRIFQRACSGWCLCEHWRATGGTRGRLRSAGGQRRSFAGRGTADCGWF